MSSVMHQNTGIQSLKDVSLVRLDTLGTLILTNAHAVKHPDKSLAVVVSALHQKHNGVKQPEHALVQLTPSETTVFHAHHQDNGIPKQTLASALHQQPNGMVLPVSAQQENMDPRVFNALLQDTGIIRQINAHAQHLLFGTEKSVLALNHISSIKEDAQFAQPDTIGNKTDARNANATTRIWKF